LLESALFGHVKGAYTGADQDRKGCFELAHGGTLFLDEVAELSPEAQATLLRVVEDGVVRRVVGDEEIAVDVRLLVATHRDLALAVQEERFRQDLYYRLNVAQLTLPPLREHPSDIPLLAEHFLKESLTSAKRVIKGFSDEATELMRSYPWPGNVRELRNAVERAVLFGKGDMIEASDFEFGADKPDGNAGPEQLPSLEEVELEHIKRVLRAVGWKRGEAARILGVDRKTLFTKCKEHGLTPGE